MDITAELLHDFEIFHDLPLEVLGSIAAIARHGRVRAGSELFTAGQDRTASQILMPRHPDPPTASCGTTSPTVSRAPKA